VMARCAVRAAFSAATWARFAGPAWFVPSALRAGTSQRDVPTFSGARRLRRFNVRMKTGA